MGKKVLVVGLGKTGIQTARFLIRKGAEIRASDITPFEKLPEDARKLEKIGVKIEAGQHKNETFLWADKIVLSPGVPFGLPPVKEAMA
ncbi:MAG: UDP-N-acetylmuramoyl-L-alanine--D-glutamate ligase, partial [Thermodesulfobacteriota bacterium]